MNTIAANLSARSNNRLEVGVILFILTHEKYSAAIARSTTSTRKLRFSMPTKVRFHCVRFSIFVLVKTGLTGF